MWVCLRQSRAGPLISEGWLQLYNEERPHRALGRLPPMRFAERQRTLENSSYPLST